MRPAPTRTPTPADAEAVRLAAEWSRQLALEEARLEPVSFEEIEAWVDGAGDDVDRALFAERLECDPVLAAAVADLSAFRSGLAGETPRPETARILPFRRPEFRRKLGWAAAAAAALVAAVLVGPSARHRQVEVQVAAPAAPAPAESAPLFTDGFEEGSSASWSQIHG
jgi:hypothetical protein